MKVDQRSCFQKANQVLHTCVYLACMANWQSLRRRLRIIVIFVDSICHNDIGFDLTVMSSAWRVNQTKERLEPGILTNKV